MQEGSNTQKHHEDSLVLAVLFYRWFLMSDGLTRMHYSYSLHPEGFEGCDGLFLCMLLGSGLRSWYVVGQRGDTHRATLFHASCTA